MHLFIIYVGGKHKDSLIELHDIRFVVADSIEAEAKQKARSTIAHWESPHKDYIHTVDEVLNINDLISKSGMYIHLTLTDNPVDFKFICRYVPVGREI